MRFQKRFYKAALLYFSLIAAMAWFSIRTSPGTPPTRGNLAVILQELHTQSRLQNPPSLTLSETASIIRSRLRGYPKKMSRTLAKHLMQLCKKSKFDPLFVLAVIHVESSFNVQAVSDRGATGLMQIMPATATHILNKMGKPRSLSEMELMDPFLNLTLGVHYLSELRARYRGHPIHYLAAYNAGPHNWNRSIAKSLYLTRASQKYLEAIAKTLSTMRAPLRPPLAQNPYSRTNRAARLVPGV